jgi:hypothetical protein
VAMFGELLAGPTSPPHRSPEVTVARLRVKLESDPWPSGYGIAEPGLGYRPCAHGEVVG